MVNKSVKPEQKRQDTSEELFLESLAVTFFPGTNVSVSKELAHLTKEQGECSPEEQEECSLKMKRVTTNPL